MSPFWWGFLCGVGLWVVLGLGLATAFVFANRLPSPTFRRSPRFNSRRQPRVH